MTREDAPQEDERTERRRYARRGALLLGLKAAVAAVLAGRLFQLQVIENRRYASRAERLRVDLRLVPPPRGRIFDAAGRLLADRAPTYGLYLRLDDLALAQSDLEKLERLLAMSAAERAAVRLKVARALGVAPRRRPAAVEIGGDVGWSAYARVNANAPAMPSVSARIGAGRRYPEGGALAHVVGFVGAPSAADRAADPDPYLGEPDARMGRDGVERALDRPLRGVAGVRRIEVDAFRRELRELTREEPVAGEDASLTIDAGLQRAVARRLGTRRAAAVVMDVRSGDVRAHVSTPSFDPNLFAGGLSDRAWRALQDDRRAPLLDRASAGLYPPGSTFKMITALAGLAAGALDPQAVVTCRGHLDYGGRRFHCWRREGHGPMRLADALTQSCDVYFYTLAQRLDPALIAETARRFGAGARFEIGLPQAAAGLTPDPAWKRRERGAAWVGGDTLNLAIGQGDMLMSPLQLAVMTARLATGRAVAPRLISSLGGAARPQAEPALLDVDPAHLAQMRAAMASALDRPEGTAHAARVAEPRWAIAGKTGTSQIRAISAEERAAGVRENDDLPEHLRDHALFVAYAPQEAPRFAAAVVVEHGGSGAEVAAPITRDILLRAQIGSEPPLAAYPAEQRDAIARARAGEDA